MKRDHFGRHVCGAKMANMGCRIASHSKLNVLFSSNSTETRAVLPTATNTTLTSWSLAEIYNYYAHLAKCGYV